MLLDIRAMLWKELRELRHMHGDSRMGLIGLFFPILYAGIIMPLQVGPLWITWPLVLTLAFIMPALLVMVVVADSFAGERERKTLEALLATRLSDRAILLGKILTCVVYSWLFCQAMFVLGLVTLNISQLARGKDLLFFEPLCLPALLLPLISSFAVSGVGVLVSLRASTVRQAQQTLGLSVAALFIIPGMLISMLPKMLTKDKLESIKAIILSVGWETLVAAFIGAVLLAGIVAMFIALRLFRRARLILD